MLALVPYSPMLPWDLPATLIPVCLGSRCHVKCDPFPGDDAREQRPMFGRVDQHVA